MMLVRPGTTMLPQTSTMARVATRPAAAIDALVTKVATVVIMMVLPPARHSDRQQHPLIAYR
jgi:hypothetical protein